MIEPKKEAPACRISPAATPTTPGTALEVLANDNFVNCDNRANLIKLKVKGDGSCFRSNVTTSDKK